MLVQTKASMYPYYPILNRQHETTTEGKNAAGSNDIVEYTVHRRINSLVLTKGTMKVTLME
jgi:hypothetical protein